MELISAAYYVSIVLRYDVSWSALRFLLIGSLLLTAALVDMDIMELPDGLLLAAALLAVLRVPEEGFMALVHAFLGAAAASIPLLLLVLLADRLMGQETMGGGDIKLMADDLFKPRPDKPFSIDLLNGEFEWDQVQKLIDDQNRILNY